MFIVCTRSHDMRPTVVITDGSMLSPVPSRAHGLNRVEIPHNALGVCVLSTPGGVAGRRRHELYTCLQTKQQCKGMYKFY